MSDAGPKMTPTQFARWFWDAEPRRERRSDFLVLLAQITKERDESHERARLVLRSQLDDTRRDLEATRAALEEARRERDEARALRAELEEKWACDRAILKGRTDEMNRAHARLHTAQEALKRIEGGWYDTPEDDSEAACVAMQTDARATLRALAEPPGETTGPGEDQLRTARGLLASWQAVRGAPHGEANCACNLCERTRNFVADTSAAPASRDSTRGTAAPEELRCDWKSWCVRLAGHDGDCEPSSPSRLYEPASPLDSALVLAVRCGRCKASASVRCAGSINEPVTFHFARFVLAGKTPKEEPEPTPPSTKGTCATCAGSKRVKHDSSRGLLYGEPCPDCAPQSEVGK